MRGMIGAAFVVLVAAATGQVVQADDLSDRYDRVRCVCDDTLWQIQQSPIVLVSPPYIVQRDAALEEAQSAIRLCDDAKIWLLSSQDWMRTWRQAMIRGDRVAADQAYTAYIGAVQGCRQRLDNAETTAKTAAYYMACAYSWIQ